MVSMTLDEYAALDDKITALPKRESTHGLTERELTRMEQDPDKYYKLAMHLLNQSYYKKNAKPFTFDNSDALSQETVTVRLELLLSDCLNITEEEGESC